MALPGWKEMIVCDGPDCDFNALGELVKVLLNNMVVISTYLAVGAFMYAGFVLLTSQGDEGALKRAKNIFNKVMIGYIWILIAWIVVYTITSVLLKDGYSFLG